VPCRRGVGEDCFGEAMTAKKCKCHPDSPFLWKQNPRPSIFLQDQAFRAKGVVANTDYKIFGSYSRAVLHTKPKQTRVVIKI
jgi:hypothetical protein